MSNVGNAKVTEHDLVIAPKQHIFWLDILVDESPVMNILQGRSYLLDIGEDQWRW